MYVTVPAVQLAVKAAADDIPSVHLYCLQCAMLQIPTARGHMLHCLLLVLTHTHFRYGVGAVDTCLYSYPAYMSAWRERPYTLTLSLGAASVPTAESRPCKASKSRLL
jgi:hypothetical protein